MAMIMRRGRWGFVIAVLLATVASALFAPWVAPHDPTVQDLLGKLQPPAWVDGGSLEHPLGTDGLGRDILSRIMYGSRVSLLVGTVAVGIGALVGVSLGLLAGYFGRWVDGLIMRIADIQLSFPFILLALAIIGVLGASLRNLVLVLGLASWMFYARMVRAEVLSLKEREYVTAAKAIGAASPRVIVRHVLPNVAHIVVVIATLEVARMILMESALSFLGLGVQPPTPSWGGMLNDSQLYMATAWWLTAFPGLAIVFTVLAVNLLGDVLRDVLDPRL